MIRFALLALALTGCTGSSLDFMPADDMAMGESNSLARLAGTVEDATFDHTASVWANTDANWSDMMVMTENTDGVFGMTLFSFEGDISTLFATPGIRTMSDDSQLGTQLCGGEDGDMYYDEPADETKVEVEDNGDGTRDVRITAFRGDDRFQRSEFTLEGDGFNPVAR